jgi:molecular chaperone GrpE
VRSDDLDTNGVGKAPASDADAERRQTSSAPASDAGAESDAASQDADGSQVDDAPLDAAVRDSGDDQGEQVDADFDALLADVTRERDEYLQLAQRARADFENYRKRAARDASDAERRGKASIVRDLVPVVDNLERALLAGGVNPDGPDTAEIEASTQEVSAQEALTQGVALVYRELREALARAGVESYDPSGERFDPTWHEALSTRPAEPGSGLEAGVVAETLQKGYRLDGQVLRPARVVVVG